MSQSSPYQTNRLKTDQHDDKKPVHEGGALTDDNPLDLSEGFGILCDACRRGDLKVCQEMISKGVNINARDSFDYTPLILASLCGHFEVVRLLLDSGALCERDTFQGERCLHNALNDRIRRLLLEYDYSKSTDPLQLFAAHISSLLTREHPRTSDIRVTDGEELLFLHKFILAARSPYFRMKLSAAPGVSSWRLPSTVPPQAFGAAIRYLYLGEVPRELRSGPGTGYTESEVIAGVDKIARHLEIPSLLDGILEISDRRLVGQRRSAEAARGQIQLETWFRDNVLAHKVIIEVAKVDGIKWDHNNPAFADVLLRADEPIDGIEDSGPPQTQANGSISPNVTPASRGSPRTNGRQKSILFPAHRAMLLRSEFFNTMFSSQFREAQTTDYLQIVHVDCSPEILEIVLTFIYTEKADFSLDVAVDVLFAADQLLIEKLKTKAALVINSLGGGTLSRVQVSKSKPKESLNGNVQGLDEGYEEELDVYDIIRAAWLTRVQRLEEFAARYLAYRLEAHIDLPEFAQLIQDSAARIKERQETDSIELLDDIRFFLSERFRLRFDDTGLGEMLTINTPKREANMNGGVQTIVGAHASAVATQSNDPDGGFEIFEDKGLPQISHQHGPTIRTLDGKVVSDEFASDAINYQILMGRLDKLLERLNLDA